MVGFANTEVLVMRTEVKVMLRGAVIVGLMAVGSFQPLFGEDFKFKVTPTRDFTLGLTVFGGPLLMLDACWITKSCISCYGMKTLSILRH